MKIILEENECIILSVEKETGKLKAQLCLQNKGSENAIAYSDKKRIFKPVREAEYCSFVDLLKALGFNTDKIDIRYIEKFEGDIRFYFNHPYYCQESGEIKIVITMEDGMVYFQEYVPQGNSFAFKGTLRNFCDAIYECYIDIVDVE